ncbi:CbtA family protein [Azospirillum halopraeferens]|uniref:CbtA family protein n=1 Tax=Azospirillum halopraeferens TaxID=34010 RepID=UPI00041C8FE0|nr:CbtA family protein [Azospirillum halopraeferens]
MFGRLVLAAVTAGVLAGAAVSVVQQVTTVPLILSAEVYEVAAEAAGHAGHAAAHAGAGFGFDAARVGLTVLTNLVIGSGYGLLLAAAMLLIGAPVNLRRGVLWGAGGFVAFTLAPAFGLPPELPGTATAELAARQAWWLAAALTAAAALLAAAFARRPAWVIAALAVAALPHLIGAPHAEPVGSLTPPELAARFAAVSIGVAALFWAVLGAACGALMSRLLPDDAR